MVITYTENNSLCVNITSRCTNRCEFCSMEHTKLTIAHADPRIENEPSLDEIIADVSAHNLDKFDEIVFCGFGEPTCRLYDMLATCKVIRELTSTPIRVNTNGHASMIFSEDMAPAFKGLVDCVSVSLNAADSDTYMKLCRPKFGEDTFSGVTKFAREIAKYVPSVEITAVRGTLSDSDIERCRQIAAGIGAGFRIRDLV